MKKYFKFLLLSVLFVCIPFGMIGITGCGEATKDNIQDIKEYEEFMKEYAVPVEKVKNRIFNGFISNIEIQNPIFDSSYNDYTFIHNNNKYTNVFSGKEVISDNELLLADGKTKLYTDKTNIYDITGTKTKLNPTDLETKKIGFLVIGKNSKLYTTLTGQESIDKELVVLNVVSYNDKYYGFNMLGDDAILANNILSKNECESFLNNIFFGKILKNDKNIVTLVTENQELKVTIRYDQSNSINHFISIEKENVKTNSNTNKYADFGDLNLEIKLKGKDIDNPILFQSYIKEVTDSKADYDYIVKDRHFQNNILMNGEKIENKNKFVPAEYRLSKNGDYAYLLGYKILKSKKLSEEQYCVKITKDGFEKELSKNISLFTEEGTFDYFLIDNNYYKVPDVIFKVASDKFGIVFNRVPHETEDKIYHFNYFLMPTDSNQDIEFKDLKIDGVASIINYKELWNNQIWFKQKDSNYDILYSVKFDEKINDIVVEKYDKVNIISEEDMIFSIDNEIYHMGIKQDINVKDSSNHICNYTFLGERVTMFGYKDSKLNKYIIKRVS